MTNHNKLHQYIFEIRKGFQCEGLYFLEKSTLFIIREMGDFFKMNTLHY
jgi:hypothetical protein